MVKKIIRKVLEKLGYQIQKIDPVSSSSLYFTMFEALKRCVDRGLNINTVIDIGASNGSWSYGCLQYLPSAHYLLIEAQKPHKKGLDKFVNIHKNADYIIAAAANTDGKIYFNNQDLLGGAAWETAFEENCIEVDAVKIDTLISERNLKAPYLIKLDTHGFEIPILEGAAETLKNAELIIIEAYNYQLNSKSLKYYQLCEYMETKGFASIEIADLLLRDYDKSLWQMDIFFIPITRKEFMVNQYC
jgi:FkbM family methyltransferase